MPKLKVKSEKSKKDYYDEIKMIKVFTIIKDVPVHQRLIITLALTGALRHREILNIGINKDIDFENNTIPIRRSLQKTKDHEMQHW